MSDSNRTTDGHSLTADVVHLAPDGDVHRHEAGPAFWQRLMSGEMPEIGEGRLVTGAVSAADWDSWEMHPAGDEIVMLLSGAADLVIETPADGGGETRVVSLREVGAFAIVPRGCWHTLRVVERCRMVFITAGAGTLHRPVGAA